MRSRQRARLGTAAAALLALGVALAYGWTTGAERSGLAHRDDNLLRLHVVAHSNDPRDQQVKLSVRDALLTELKSLGLPKSREEAEARVKAHEERLVHAAREALRREGFDLPVRIDVGEFYFPEKSARWVYLPAGEYRAIKVVIGDGAGHNWWCVLFPPLCFVEEEGEPVPTGDAPGEQRQPPAVMESLAWSPGEAGATGRPQPAPVSVSSGEQPAAGSAGEGGEAMRAVRWRMRLWEKLSETAYAARLREMVELARRSLREESL